MKSIKYLIILFLGASQSLFSQSPATSYDKEAYEFMDNCALSGGTDKSSSFHNYTKIYSQYFKGCKDEPIKFVEIGIYKGNSVKFWENYFSQADLHFVDITDVNIEYHSTRSKYHFLDQSNISQMRHFGDTEGPFDIILDDGGHYMDMQIASFIALFSSVKSGGLYIIEDLHTSYWKCFHGSGNIEAANEGTAVGYLKNLVDLINFPGAASHCADPDKLSPDLKAKMKGLREEIAAIHFYPSVCIIEKK